LGKAKNFLDYILLVSTQKFRIVEEKYIPDQK
jgi:hypothetical protein